MSTDSREAFEAWFNDQRLQSWRRSRGKPYQPMPAHWCADSLGNCWEAWQAARAATARECAELCEGLAKEFSEKFQIEGDDETQVRRLQTRQTIDLCTHVIRERFGVHPST